MVITFLSTKVIKDQQYLHFLTYQSNLHTQVLESNTLEGFIYLFINKCGIYLFFTKIIISLK